MISFDHFSLWSNLVGGLALFLLGLDILTRALKAVAGNRMRTLIAKVTTNRFTGVVTGAVATGIINSSSVTTVMLVGLISAGLMSMPQSIALIMGANIGTTVTTQIIAFKITKFALPLFAGGLALTFVTRNETLKEYGAMTMGLGLVFFGMTVMSDAMMPLRDHPPFLDLMIAMDNVLLLVLISAAFTAIIQTSSATVGIAMALAAHGLIDLDGAIALALGANVGTCVTAMLAAIGKPREAVRAAVAHVVFNVAGVIVWIGIIPELEALARAISPAPLPQDGSIAGVNSREIANAHTIFNVANTALFIGFSDHIARFVEWLIPNRPLHGRFATKAQYLDPEWLATPAFAVERARSEVGRLGDDVGKMFNAVIPAILEGRRTELRAVAETQYFVDFLHGQVVDYLRKANQVACADRVARDIVRLIHISDQFAHIGTIIESNLVHLGHRAQEEGTDFGDDSAKMILAYQRRITRGMAFAVRVARGRNGKAAGELTALQDRVAKHADDTARRELRGLMGSDRARLNRYRHGMEMIEHMTRIYDHCLRVAATVPRQTRKPENK